MFNCPHLFPGATITEIFRKSGASEITQLKNGTLISVIGRMKQVKDKQVSIYRLQARKQHTPSSEKVPIFNPFTKHEFNMMYVSDKFFLRKGVQTENWEMMKRLDPDSDYPLNFKGLI